MTRPASGASPRRGAACLLLVAVVLSLSACSAKAKPATSGLPDGAMLLSQSSQVMGGVTTAHFSLQVEGTLSPLPIRSAEGVLARGGQAKASAVVDLFGQLISYQVVLTGGKAYLKGPTGGYAVSPASEIPDVSLLLDPGKGVASLLSQATGAATQDRETVNGVDSYKVIATVPTAVVAGFASLAPGQDHVAATLWIEANGSHLVQARIPLTLQGTTKPIVLTPALSDFNAPVDIQAPSTS